MGETLRVGDDKSRIERLATLGRLWGAAKYFHPALAYGDIDRDAALIAAIPKVRQAQSARDYRDAIDGLLAVLHDPVTRTVGQVAAAPVPGAPEPAVRRTTSIGSSRQSGGPLHRP